MKILVVGLQGSIVFDAIIRFFHQEIPTHYVTFHSPLNDLAQWTTLVSTIRLENITHVVDGYDMTSIAFHTMLFEAVQAALPDVHLTIVGTSFDRVSDLHEFEECVKIWQMRSKLLYLRFRTILDFDEETSVVKLRIRLSPSPFRPVSLSYLPALLPCILDLIELSVSDTVNCVNSGFTSQSSLLDFVAHSDGKHVCVIRTFAEAHEPLKISDYLLSSLKFQDLCSRLNLPDITPSSEIMDRGR